MFSTLILGSPCPARTGDNSVNSRVLYQCKHFIPISTQLYLNLNVEQTIFQKTYCFVQSFHISKKRLTKVSITVDVNDNVLITIKESMSNRESKSINKNTKMDIQYRFHLVIVIRYSCSRITGVIH